MSTYVQHYYSHRQRWREGTISCFAWPSNEVIQTMKTTLPVGDEIIVNEKMPNWRHRVASGVNATTTYISEESTIEYTPGHIFIGKWCTTNARFGYFQFDGDLFQDSGTVWDKPAAPSTTLHAKTSAEALSRAIQDARSKQTHFRGGNFLAELTDTLRGIRNPAKGFRGLLDTYRKNARRRVKQAVGRRNLPTTQQDFRALERDAPDVSRAAQRALSDTWLESNFGWQPLLSDAVDAYQALRRLSLRTPLARFYGASDCEDPPTYTSGTRPYDITNVDWITRNSSSYDVKYYGAVKIETSCSSGEAVEEMGVRARDFLPAVWEAIPYSFLIDYFTNVGDIIEAASFPKSDLAWMARTFRNHSLRSTERIAVREYTLHYPANNSNKLFSFRPAFVKWDRMYVNRIAYSGSFIPTIRFEIPGPRNWKKWFNMAALARMRTL